MCNYNLLSVFLVIITVTNYIYITNASRKFILNGVETILAVENEDVEIECKANDSLKYCGLTHPNGKRQTFTELNTLIGKCSMQINVTSNDTGTWYCHTGTATEESTKLIKLRVVGKLAAVESNVMVTSEKSFLLYCMTVEGSIPLKYCRFEPPVAPPFNIDSRGTITNSLPNRFVFPPNKSLKRGDCAVIINKAMDEDVGHWKCGAAFEDGKEYTAVINVQIEGIYLTVAAEIGFLLFFAVFFTIMNMRCVRRCRCCRTNLDPDESVEAYELEEMPTEDTPFRRRSPPPVEENIPPVDNEPEPLPGTVTPPVPAEDREEVEEIHDEISNL